MSTPGGPSAPSDASLPSTPAKTDVGMETAAAGSPASVPGSGQETPGKQVNERPAAAASWRPRRALDPAEQLRRDTNVGLI